MVYLPPTLIIRPILAKKPPSRPDSLKAPIPHLTFLKYSEKAFPALLFFLYHRLPLFTDDNPHLLAQYPQDQLPTVR